MFIKSSEASVKEVGPMDISSYKINSDYSGSIIEIDGDHGKLKCLNEDRIYLVIEGEGKFIVDGEEKKVSKEDLIFVPENTPYNFRGDMKLFLVCSPEFDPEDDVFMD